MLMRINTYSVPFSLCCLLEDARCERDLCQVSCGIPGSGWPCWMLMLCHSRTPYAVALALKRSPCTPQMGPRLQLPTSCSCGTPRCAETAWLVFGLLNRWKMRLFGKGCSVSEFTLMNDSITKNMTHMLKTLLTLFVGFPSSGQGPHLVNLWF